MSRNKLLKCVLCGALVAAVIALIAGIILYVPSVNAEISADAENYFYLLTAKARKIIAGLILLFSGGFVAAVSALGLLITAAIGKIQSKK